MYTESQYVAHREERGGDCAKLEEFEARTRVDEVADEREKDP
jgi:hypothetical protein